MFSKIYQLNPGDLISTSTHLVYRHFGIVTARGTVISNSARCAGSREESLEEFCCGKPWRIEPRPSDLPGEIVLHNARQLMTRPYNLFAWNCESFVAACYGLPPRSDQVMLSVLIAAFGVIAVVGLTSE